MRIEFDDGTLLLRDAPEMVPYAEWDDRVDTFRAQAYRYRALLEWAGKWNDGGGQATLDSGFSHNVKDEARAYPDLALAPALQIEPREYQQAALDSWRTHDRQGTVVLPTGSGKTFLGLQAIADAGVSALVVTPTIDLMNQWHATLTNAFGEQLTDDIGVLGGGSHEIGALTVTTYDSAYRYIDEYGDRFGLLVTDETYHLAAETYLQIPEMTLAPYRLGLTATYERADGREALLEDRIGPVVYEEAVDELAGEFLSEYETIQMSVDLTPSERTEYDEEYQIYWDYVDSHDFDLWKEQGYAEFLKRTSYDPQGRRANNDFAYDISPEFILPCITHQTDTDERTEILERFRSGEYSMLATSKVLDEGIDVPAANVGIILSGSASKRQYAQRLGRILRPTDDRQPARLYEIIATDTMETYVSQRRREGVRSSADG